MSLGQVTSQAMDVREGTAMELQEIPFLSNVKILIGAVRNPWVVWGFCRMLGTGVDGSKSQRRLDDCWWCDLIHTPKQKTPCGI